MLCAKNSGIAKGKLCQSLEGNVWRKVDFMSKKNGFWAEGTLFHRYFMAEGRGEC